MAARVLRLRWAATCRECAADLPAGTEAAWDRDAKAATCVTCTSTASSGAPAAVAGSSARREYEARQRRERQRKEAAVARDAEWRTRVIDARPVLGRLATLMTPKPVVGAESQATRAWADGAAGEELLGQVLDRVTGVVVLHDRRVPHTKANIDHVAVASSGIYVIDAKNYDGLVERRVAGGWFNRDERLFVNGRDRTRLVDGVVRQAEVVRSAIGPSDVPIYSVLCFVGPTWRRFFARPLSVRGVPVLWAAKVVELLEQRGDFANRVDATAALIATKLPPA